MIEFKKINNNVEYMLTLTLVLIPMLLVDMVNPVLLAGVLYGIGSRHPIRNSLAILGSFFFSYFVSGVVILLGFELFAELFKLPKEFDYILEFIIAVMLFALAFKMYREGDTHIEEDLKKERTVTLKGAFLMGFNINIIGLPFALPYLAAIDQLLKASLNPIVLLLFLLAYNLLYVLPFSLLLTIPYFFEKESEAVFQKIYRWMHFLIARYLPIILFILGVLLLEDCVSYLLGYREYSWLRIR